MLSDVSTPLKEWGNDRIAKRVCEGKCVGRPQKRWIDSLNDYLEKIEVERWTSKEDGV